MLPREGEAGAFDVDEESDDDDETTADANAGIRHKVVCHVELSEYSV